MSYTSCKILEKLIKSSLKLTFLVILETMKIKNKLRKYMPSTFLASIFMFPFWVASRNKVLQYLRFLSASSIIIFNMDGSLFVLSHFIDKSLTPNNFKV